MPFPVYECLCRLKKYVIMRLLCSLDVLARANQRPFHRSASPDHSGLFSGEYNTILEMKMEIKNASKATAGLIVRDPVSTVLLSTHVLDVAKIMVEQNVGSVVVVRDYEPLGIITERDILERVVLANKNANEVVAQEIMTAPLLTIDSNRKIDEALAIMRKNHLRRLVVVNGDRLVGIVTERRLLLAQDSLE
jgi:CBS domain-containing protein